jgi:hypothetical protein
MSYDDEVTMFAGEEPSYSRVSLEKHAEDDSSDDGTSSPTDSLLGLYQKKLKRRFTNRAIIASVAVSIWLVSSVASYWLGLRSVDLDRKCLEHSSAYCKLRRFLILIEFGVDGALQLRFSRRWNLDIRWFSSTAR